MGQIFLVMYKVFFEDITCFKTDLQKIMGVLKCRNDNYRRRIVSNKNSNEILKKIEENYNGFSKRQKLLADYITKNYDKAAFLTAAKLGSAVGVSESTVVRFATELGYKGYPGFQKSN